MNIKNIALITLILIPTISNSTETSNRLVAIAQRIGFATAKAALTSVTGGVIVCCYKNNTLETGKAPTNYLKLTKFTGLAGALGGAILETAMVLAAEPAYNPFTKKQEETKSLTN